MNGRPDSTAPAPWSARVTATVVRAVLFAGLWWALSRGDAGYLGYGVAVVAAATALSLAVAPPARRPAPRTWPARFARSLMLAGWFLGKSFAGGIDVALRALRPTADIDPYVETVPVTLPAGAPRELASLMINLMPGTVIQDATAGAIELHVLSPDLDAAGQWAELERRVAGAFGVDRVAGAFGVDWGGGAFGVDRDGG